MALIDRADFDRRVDVEIDVVCDVTVFSIVDIVAVVNAVDVVLVDVTNV